MSNGVADAARPAVAFAGAVVTAGALISLLVPNIPAEHEPPMGSVQPGTGPTEPEEEADSEYEPTSA